MLSTTTDVVVRRALDGLAARHRAYANNLANVETPGFQPSDVPFETELRRVRDDMRSGAVRGVAQDAVPLEPVPQAASAEAMGPGALEIDDQAVRLEENTLAYAALSQAARIRGEMLRAAISEGRR